LFVITNELGNTISGQSYFPWYYYGVQRRIPQTTKKILIHLQSTKPVCFTSLDFVAGYGLCNFCIEHFGKFLLA